MHPVPDRIGPAAVRRLQWVHRLVQLDPSTSVALGGSLRAGVVHEDLAHQVRCDTQKNGRSFIWPAWERAVVAANSAADALGAARAIGIVGVRH
jgi:hypothetical protein